MGIPDTFDPTMQLNTAKDVGNPSPPGTPGDASRLPGDVAAFDPTANTGTIPRDVSFAGTENPLSAGGVLRQPPDVQTFNGSAV